MWIFIIMIPLFIVIPFGIAMLFRKKDKKDDEDDDKW